MRVLRVGRDAEAGVLGLDADAGALNELRVRLEGVAVGVEMEPSDVRPRFAGTIRPFAGVLPFALAGSGDSGAPADLLPRVEAGVPPTDTALAAAA